MSIKSYTDKNTESHSITEILNYRQKLQNSFTMHTKAAWPELHWLEWNDTQQGLRQIIQT